MLTMAVWSATHVGTLMSETVHWQLRFPTIVRERGLRADHLARIRSSIHRPKQMGFRTTHRVTVSRSRTDARIRLHGITRCFTVRFRSPRSAASRSRRTRPLTRRQRRLLVYAVTDRDGAAGRCSAHEQPALQTPISRPSDLCVHAVVRQRCLPHRYQTGPRNRSDAARVHARRDPACGLVLRTDLTTFVPIAHERVFQTLDDPVLVISPDDRILEANASAQSVLGADRPLEGVAAEAVLPAELSDGEPFHLPSRPPSRARYRSTARRGGSSRSVEPSLRSERPTLKGPSSR